MTKQYFLYLDESGDFDKNLTEYWSSECIVGGLFFPSNNLLTDREVEVLFSEAVKEADDSLAGLSVGEIKYSNNHSTEQDGANGKGEKNLSILRKASKLGQFVIFENYSKNKVLDSTRTYIYIMVDGILQLLDQLILDNPGDRIVLDVSAGKRRDMTLNSATENIKSKYIEDKCYLERLNETLQYMKVKHPDIMKYGKVNISLKNDKKNPYLIFCDYICNSYFTRGCQAFGALKDDSKTYWDYMSEFYKSEYLFSVGKNTERELIEHYIYNNDYAAALFDYCVGAIQNEHNVEIILHHLTGLNEQNIKNSLFVLSGYIHDLIEGRDLEFCELILNQAEKIVKYIDETGICKNVTLEFALNIALYRATILNHQGKILDMEQQLEKSRSMLESLLIETSNLEYAYIYYNRYAVFLIDNFEFEKAQKIIDESLKLFTAYNLIISDLPGFNIDENVITSSQKGKLLGTLVQCENALLTRELSEYETIIEISEEACKNLSPSDQRRQYQYRAISAGIVQNYDAAMEYLCMGYDVKDWKSLLDDSREDHGFALYHLSTFARYFAGDDIHDKYIGEIIKALKTNSAKYIGKNEHPYFLTCANVAYSIFKNNKNIAEAEKYYRYSFSEVKEQFILEILSLIVFAEFVGICGTMVKETDISSLSERCQNVLKKEPNKEIADIMMAIISACKEKAYSNLLEIGKMRQY